jgi:AAA family ATPase
VCFLVRRSLISSSSDQLDAFPLVKLFEECNRFFDLDLDNDLLYGEAGKNFMVSTVFPLREVCLSIF